MAKIAASKQDLMIKEEISKLQEILSEISEEKQKAAAKLIERVAFMTVTLQILEDDIKRKGPTYKFKQGAQEMIVENPSQKSYNTMINRYTAAYDKLFSLLPKEAPKDDGDGFEAFVNGR